MPSRNNPPLRVMIVEDQGLIRAFLENWLAALPRFSLAASARSGEEALQLLELSKPDLALVDFQLPGIDGLEFIRSARQSRPQLRALVLTSLVDPLALTRVRESGVEGYVEKDASPQLLAEALNSLADGHSFYSEKFHQTLAREGAKTQAVGKILSRREQQVLIHIMAQKSNKDIAKLMNLSTRTVEFHRANLMAKLDAANVAELIANAAKRGWKS